MLNAVDMEGLGELDSTSKYLLKQFMPTYRREAKKYAPQLAKVAQKYIRRGINEVPAVAYLGAKKAATEPSEPTPQWLQDLIDPMLGPTQEVVKSELMRVMVPAASALGVIAIAAAIATFMLGRVTKKCIAR